MEQRDKGRGYPSPSRNNHNHELDNGGIVDISEEGFWQSPDRYKGQNKGYQKAYQDYTEDHHGNDHHANDDHHGGIESFPEDVDLEITSVQLMKRPKYRYVISFGRYSLEVHEDVMIKYRMIKGTVFNKAELIEIVVADEKERVYSDALQYLSRKPRTGYEISVRLREKGWGEDIVNDVLNRLSEEGLVNDALYAQEWAGQRVKSRGKGKLWVRQELRQKGVSKPLIEEALVGVSEEDEYDSALQLGSKKWNSTSGEYIDKKRKVGAFLMRRGFSGGLVSRVLRELADNDGADSSEDWEEV